MSLASSADAGVKASGASSSSEASASATIVTVTPAKGGFEGANAVVLPVFGNASVGGSVGLVGTVSVPVPVLHTGPEVMVTHGEELKDFKCIALWVMHIVTTPTGASPVAAMPVSAIVSGLLVATD